MDLKEAYYKSYKPLFNLENLYKILLIQQKVAEIFQEGCNLEIILYLKTMTSMLIFPLTFSIEKELYDKLGLFQYKDSFNRTLNQGLVHYQSLINTTKSLCQEVKPTQFYE